jgi:hypothetical protein
MQKIDLFDRPEKSGDRLAHPRITREKKNKQSKQVETGVYIYLRDRLHTY